MAVFVEDDDVGEGWIRFVDPSPYNLTWSASLIRMPSLLSQRSQEDRIGLHEELGAALSGRVFLMQKFLAVEDETDARKIMTIFPSDT